MPCIHINTYLFIVHTKYNIIKIIKKQQKRMFIMRVVLLIHPSTKEKFIITFSIYFLFIYQKSIY